MNTSSNFKIDSAAAMEDFHEKYSGHLLYLRQQARAFAARYRQEDRIKDLEQEGVIALIRAAKKYNPSKAKFITYFRYWLRLYLFHACISWMYAIHVPNEQLIFYNKYCRMRKDGHSNAEIAAALHLPVRKLMDLVKNVHNSQNLLTGEIQELDEGCSNARVPGETYFEPAETRMTNSFYLEIFEYILDPMERSVIARHFGFRGPSISLNQLRFEMWGVDKDKPVTRERLRQIKDSALKKLKDYFEYIGLDETGHLPPDYTGVQEVA